MAKSRTGEKAGGKTEHLAHWQQPWVQKVMQGGYSAFTLLLFERVSSFGVSGCSMKNITLMAGLPRKERTIQQSITALWKGEDLLIVNWNGHGRRIYAAKNPEVLAMFREKYDRERKAGTVDGKVDFLRKMRVRGYTTPQKLAGIPAETCGEGRRNLRGDPAENCGDSISKVQERYKEKDLRRADSSSAADEQPNPPAIDGDGEDNLAKLREKVQLKGEPSGPPLTQAEMKDKVQKQKTALMAVDQMDQEGGKQ